MTDEKADFDIRKEFAAIDRWLEERTRAATEAGRRQEREAIVAWLLRDADACEDAIETATRSRARGEAYAALVRIACKAIEAGEHVDD